MLLWAMYLDSGVLPESFYIPWMWVSYSPVWPCKLQRHCLLKFLTGKTLWVANTCISVQLYSNGYSDLHSQSHTCTCHSCSSLASPSNLSLLLWGISWVVGTVHCTQKVDRLVVIPWYCEYFLAASLGPWSTSRFRFLRKDEVFWEVFIDSC